MAGVRGAARHGARNVAATGADEGRRTTLLVEPAVVAVSGATACLHAEATTVRAACGALTAVSAVLALLLGVLLRGRHLPA